MVIEHRRRKVRRWVWVVLAIFCGVALFIGEIFLFKWTDDNKKIEKQLDIINDKVKISEDNVESVEIVENNEKEDSDYWKYIEMPLLSVDFSELSKINSDTVAFLKVNGTNVNYPIVQTTNNDYYLNHAFDKSKNKAGWVFLDYRNNIDNLDDNTIIYAHGRKDKTMFGSLNNVLKKSWYNNVDNHIIYLSTMSENTMWQIFSVYKIPTETYYLTSSFGSVDSKEKFIEEISNRSVFSFNCSTSANDKILTLSTCYNDEEKLVVHAKLIKRA